MENNNIIRTIYTHDKFGTLRIIYHDGKFLFCAKDILRIFELSDRHSLSRYCKFLIKGVHQTNGGLHVMNFIGIDDVMRLYEHSKADYAEEFILSIDEIEEDFERDLFGEDYDDEEDDEEEECYEDGHDEGYLELLERNNKKDEEEPCSALIDKKFTEELCEFLDGLDRVHEFVNNLFEDPENAMKLFLTSLEYNADSNKIN